MTTEPRGFIALLAVGGTSVALLMLAVSVTADAFTLRRMVLQYEYQAAAALAAEACAQSVVLRIIQGDTAELIPAYVTLAGGKSCHIDRVDQTPHTYLIYSSARVGSAQARSLTEVEVIDHVISHITSRKI